MSKDNYVGERKNPEVMPIKKIILTIAPAHDWHMIGIAITAKVDAAVCMDWCCHYGSNCLFKSEFCWITYEVDYMNQNRTFTKRMEITKKNINILKSP